MRYSVGERSTRAPAADGLLQGVQIRDAERVEGGVGRALAAADEGLGAGDEFAEVEGLGEVVVGAGVEQLDDGVLAPSLAVRMRTGVASWRARRRRSRLEAVELGQHQVENDEVVAAVAGEVVAGLAVGGPIDRETGTVAQGGGQVVRQPNFIFHEQDAHVRHSSPLTLSLLQD